MTGTTRRAAIGAIGSIAAAGLIAGHAARADETTQNDEAEMADTWRALAVNFAHGWLEEWTKLGGSYYRLPDGSYIYGWPEYELSPVYREERAKLDQSEYFQGLGTTGHDKALRDTLIRNQEGWGSACYTGRIRALADMLENIGGLRDAVKLIVGLKPALGLPIRASEEG